MSRDIEKLWTIDDVADFLQVKASVVKYWIYNSDIPFIKLGKFYRFDPEEINIWLKKGKNRKGQTQRELQLLNLDKDIY